MNLDELQTPALLVRVDRVRANLEQMRARLAKHGGWERWRPHVKTAKTPTVLLMLIDAGLRRFKCATTREAAVMLECADHARTAIDLCVAMTHRGPNLRRIAELARAHSRHRLSVLTEDAEHARLVRSIAPTVGVFLDLDPHFGRSGVPFDDDARIAACVEAAGDALIGIHAYEGHVRDATPEERTARCTPLFERLLAIVRAHNLSKREVVTSGTPTFEQALAFDPFATLDHRVSPGIVVYWDRNSAALGIEGFQCAATVLARVLSSDGARRVTLDAGGKSLDAAAGDPCVAVRGWPELVPQRPSEEHLPLLANDARVPAVGDVVELEPRHVCPMINLADQVVLLDGAEIVGVERIAARGHEIEPPAS